jgi:hypothetical protein
MRDELLALGIKIAATAVASATMFGLTWWAIAAAVIGAAASHHFEPEQVPSKLPRLIFGIFAVGFFAALAAVAAPHLPLLKWSVDIPLGVRAGLIGVLLPALYRLGKRWADVRTAGPGG